MFYNHEFKKRDAHNCTKTTIKCLHCLFQDKDIYLLDDPLAAVDAHVGSHIFSQCIMGILKNKTRILCTHHTKYLQQADLVLVMKGGTITAAGKCIIGVLRNKTRILCTHHT